MQNHIIKAFGLFILAFIFISCKGTAQESDKLSIQKTTNQGPVGGGCETCEIMYIDMPATINDVDTSVAWQEKGQKLIIKGKVFQKDGITPAADIILYYWHTDNTGIYSSNPSLNPKAIRHGYIRGWVKTNAQGEYTLFTTRPVAYPDATEPEHIHWLVKEPNLENEYYIDDLVFADDQLLKKSIEKRPLSNRGGSGIVNIRKEGDVQIAEHIVVLGMNIPGYR